MNEENDDSEAGPSYLSDDSSSSFLGNGTSHAKQITVINLMEQYVARWSKSPLQSLTNCTVCNMLFDYSQPSTAGDGRRMAVASKIFLVNRFAMKVHEDLIGILLVWHFMHTVFDDVSAENALNIDPVSILIHCFMGRCVNEDGAMVYTDKIDQFVAETTHINKLLRQSIVALQMYDDSYLIKRHSSVQIAGYCPKIRINDYQDLRDAIEKQRQVNGMTQKKYDTVAPTTRQHEQKVRQRIRSYQQRSSGYLDLHNNEVYSVTHPDETLRMICNKSTSQNNKCVGGNLVGSRNTLSTGYNCVYASTGCMDKMADANMVPDYRKLVEYTWITRTVQETANRRNGGCGGPVNWVMGGSEMNITLRRGDFTRRELHMKLAAERARVYLTFYSKKTIDDNLPGVYVIKTFYNMQIQAELEKRLLENKVKGVDVGRCVMNSTRQEHANNFRKRLMMRVDHDSVTDASLNKKERRSASSSSSTNGSETTPICNTIVLKRKHRGFKATKPLLLDASSGGDGTTTVTNHVKYIKDTKFREMIQSSTTRQLHSSHSSLSSDSRSVAAANVLSSSRHCYDIISGNDISATSNNHVNMELERNISMQHDMEKNRVKRVNTFLLRLFRMCTTLRSTMPFCNSHVEHLHAARPLCHWCTLNLGDGMPLVINDCVKMTKEEAKQIGVGCGLSNHNIHTKGSALSVDVSTLPKCKVESDKVIPRKVIHTAALDNVYISLENMSGVYRQWFTKKYKTILYDAFREVFAGEQQLAILNNTGMSKDKKMLISPEQDYHMMNSLHSHLSSDKKVMCKANTRKTFIQCDTYHYEDTVETPLHACNAPYTVSALEALLANNAKVRKYDQDSVVTLARSHHLSTATRYTF